jgi:hypothetical protein
VVKSRSTGTSRLAGQHRVKGIATTFALIDSERPSQILGFYTLSAASLAFERLTEADRKGLPAYPVPAVRIGRLATSVSVRGQGFGELLLQNAIKRILQARNTLGVHAVVVEALDQVDLSGSPNSPSQYETRPCPLRIRSTARRTRLLVRICLQYVLNLRTRQ